MMITSVTSSMKATLQKVETLCFTLLDHDSKGIRTQSIKLLGLLPICPIENLWGKLMDKVLLNMELLADFAFVGIEQTQPENRNSQGLIFPMPKDRTGAAIILDKRMSAFSQCFCALLVSTLAFPPFITP